MSEVATIVISIVSALGVSGGMWAVLGKLLDARVARATAAHTRRLGQEERADNVEIDALRHRIEELAAEHSSCEARLTVLELAQDTHLPRWLKDEHQRITWFNARAFAMLFRPLGVSRNSVFGKTFAELLDPLAAAEVSRLDMAALATPGAPVSALIQLHPDLRLMLIIKIAGDNPEDGGLFFEGYACLPNERMLSDSMGTQRTIEARASSAARMFTQEEDGGR